MSTAELVEKLARAFYTVVPPELKTYCAFTSAVVQKVLQHHGAACKLVPCQIWYSQPGHDYVIGFLGRNSPQQTPHKWDGHVVCCTDDWLVDTATHHFQREFGLSVPSVVVAPLFTFPTTALAHKRINEVDALWWHAPPVHADTRLPEEPLELVNQHAQALIAHLQHTG